MKKFVIRKLCLFVFGALLVEHRFCEFLDGGYLTLC